MEVVLENIENVIFFWELLNEVLEKVLSGIIIMFNFIGWCIDMVGFNFSVICKVFGDSVVNCIKICEFYFKELVNFCCWKFSKDKVKQFKDMSIKFLECESFECYDDFKEQLLKFMFGEIEES